MSIEGRIRATVARYLETFSAGDREGWLDLFADGASLEDPVGTAPCRGRAAIGEFWDASHTAAERITLHLIQGPGVCGRDAAFAMEARSEIGGGRIAIPTIDVMTFDEQGRITSQRAYWNAADIRPLPAGD